MIQGINIIIHIETKNISQSLAEKKLIELGFENPIFYEHKIELNAKHLVNEQLQEMRHILINTFFVDQDCVRLKYKQNDQENGKP